jgi:hypothetical protein
MKKKMCQVVVATVAIIGLTSGPAAAASAVVPDRPQAWWCQKLHICP